jgi:hypothetical protein
MQARAKSDLVASPDGTRLLYLADDGFIYGFDILDVWRYDYFLFMRHEMATQKIKAHSCLIYPEDDRIYYIAEERFNGKRVHGFQKSFGTWMTASPTHGAVTHRSYPTPLSMQEQAGGALTYDKTAYPRTLYYSGVNGLIYNLFVHDSVTYQYDAFPGNTHLETQKLRVRGNLAIRGDRMYFVGDWQPDRSQKWVYYFDLSDSFRVKSPTWASVSGTPISSQLISITESCIAVSPDGKTIAYFGWDIRKWAAHVCILSTADGVHYSYKTLPHVVFYGPGDAAADGMDGLQFTSDTDLFYGCKVTDKRVYRCKFQEDYCENRFMKRYEED